MENRVAVVSLSYGEEYEAADDLVAGSATAVLRKHGYRVDMYEIDQSGRREWDLVLEQAYKVLFLAIPTTSNVTKLMTLSMQMKAVQPDCFVAWIGWDHHSAPIDIDDVMQHCSSIDAIVRGEGEETIVELTQLVVHKESLSHCKGITYREYNLLVTNEDRELLSNLDELPFPARDNHRKHAYRSMRISTARGCLGNCSFCPTPATRTRGNVCWRGRSPENIVDEIQYLINTYHIYQYMFIDPTFEDPGTFGKKRIGEIAELLIRKNINITFLVNMRAENWTEEDKSLLELLFQAGLESVTVGIEAGNERGLKLFNKKAGIQDFYRFISLIDEFGIYPAYGFIMFHPYSTLQDLKDNNTLLHDLGISYMTGAYTTRLKAFPYTVIYKRMQRDNLLLSTDTDQYSLYNYRFENNRVKRLLSLMEQVKNREQKDKQTHYYNVQKYDTFVSRMDRTVRFKYNDCQSMRTYVTALKKRGKQNKRQLCDYNYEWFSRCIDLVEGDGSDNDFNRLFEEHISRLLPVYNDLKSSQLIYGKKLYTLMK